MLCSTSRTSGLRQLSGLALCLLAAPVPADDLAVRGLVEVREVVAVGEDLDVAVLWRDVPALPSKAWIRLLDSRGNEVDKVRVTPVGGLATEYVLPRVLEPGSRYRLRVEGPDREALTSETEFRAVVDVEGIRLQFPP